MRAVSGDRLRWCARAAALAGCLASSRGASADEAPAAASTEQVPAAAPLPCLSAAASEQHDPAQLLDLALSCYEAEEYDASLALLERLRALDPNPVVLFNLGAAHAALGHCAEARANYEQYLEQSQSESGKADARQQLQTLSDCAGALPAPPANSLAASAPREREIPSPARPSAAVLRAPQPAADGSPFTSLDAVAPEPPSRLPSWILLGGSAALLLASGGFAYASERAEHAEATGSGDDGVRSQKDGPRYNTLAWACAGGALALATSGLVLIAFEPSADVAAARSKPLTAGAWSLRLQHQF